MNTISKYAIRKRTGLSVKDRAAIRHYVEIAGRQSPTGTAREPVPCSGLRLSRASPGAPAGVRGMPGAAGEMGCVRPAEAGGDAPDRCQSTIIPYIVHNTRATRRRACSVIKSGHAVPLLVLRITAVLRYRVHKLAGTWTASW